MAKVTLVVAVRGWTTAGEDFLLFGRPGGDLPASFLTALRTSFSNAEVLSPDLEMNMFSMRSAESLSHDVFQAISERVELGDVERIVFVGYSTGSLLARRVFCMAHGAQPDGSLTGQVAPWAKLIDRNVVLSGLTRGWEFSSAHPAHVRFLGPILYYLSLIVGYFKRQRLGHAGSSDRFSPLPFAYQVARGAPFVVATRVQYVTVMRALARNQHTAEEASLRHNGMPSTVFLLGSRDEFVSPADCTELGPRAEFVFVELPGTTHSDAVRVSGTSAVACARRERLMAALSEPLAALRDKPWVIPATDIDDYLDPMDIAEHDAEANESEQVEHVVMIVHGIRDNGFWTKRVAREVKSLARLQGISVRAPTPTYGYFSMWDFVRPGGRERATFWFMERYADVKTHFPAARISFVGHSNGTYIATRALKLCEMIEFDNLVFAGCVVRRDYDWTRLRGRVKRVLNYVGGADGVVGFLPAVFEKIGCAWLDIGGAGVFGFGETSGVHEVRFVRGGHGAAISESFWPEIARFALNGEPPERQPEPRPVHMAWLFRVAPALTVCGIAIAAGILLLPLELPLLLARGELFDALSVSGLSMIVAAGLLASWLAARFLKQW